MLVDGPNINNKGFSQGTLSCAQVMMNHFRKCIPRGIEIRRHHLKERETPLVIFNSLKLYATTRSRTLIDTFHGVGLCLSYQRVLDITKSMYDSMKTQYERDNVLLPRVLKKGYGQ